MNVMRTPDERFQDLPDYPFAPHYLEWQGMRLHYIDEGPGTSGVALLMHGEPSWSFLYRRIIPPLVAAGFRCIAPDYIGFGKSDKVTDDDWYVIERHVESIRHLIEQLGLSDITLVCQDWGGPIGLRQAVDVPERFRRLVILNTWLHHEGHEYTEGIQAWRRRATDPSVLGGDMPIEFIWTNYCTIFKVPDVERVAAAYAAPFTDYGSKAGARRFPWCIPFAEPEAGSAAEQERCFEALKSWPKPAHFIFGAADNVFPPEWGRRWASLIPGATFDEIEGAGHFLQECHGEELARVMLKRIAQE